LQRRLAVVDRRRVGVFGCQPVVHRDYDGGELSCGAGRVRVVDLNRPAHEAATVDPEDRGQPAHAVGSVDADADRRSVGTQSGHQPVFKVELRFLRHTQTARPERRETVLAAPLGVGEVRGRQVRHVTGELRVEPSVVHGMTGFGH